MYHSKENIPTQEREAGERKAETQETAILEFFERHPDECFTPPEINDEFPRYNLNSIRRAISNLTKEGKLEKTEIRREGIYGASNATWMYREPSEVTQQELFSEWVYKKFKKSIGVK